jgi:hypothetical protein
MSLVYPRSASAHPIDGRSSVRSLYRVLVLGHFALSSLFAVLAPFPAGFDELAHVSYVVHVRERQELVASFDEMLLAEPDKPSAWSAQRNYLNRPSFYYVALGMIPGPAGAPPHLLLLRLVNACLSSGALALALRIGLQAAWPASAQALFGVILATVPTLAILGGLVTNDNLAWLGGALCCLGAHGLLRDGLSGGRLSMAIGGFALASLAKLTAALLCGGLMAGALAALWLREKRCVFLDRRVLITLALASLAMLPYLAFWTQYGSPAPYTGGQAEVLQSRLAEIPEWQAQRYEFARYAAHFLLSLLMFWPPLVPRADLQILLLAAPSICVLSAALGAWIALCGGRGAERDPTALFVLCGALALGVVMAIHLGFAFERHLETGWLKGIYPRYYFPLLPVFAAACATAAAHPSLRWIVGPIMLLSIGYAAVAAVQVARGLL